MFKNKILLKKKNLPFSFCFYYSSGYLLPHNKTIPKLSSSKEAFYFVQNLENQEFGGG